MQQRTLSSHFLVGGYALAAHAHPRYTGNIDYWVRAGTDHLARLLDALKDFGFGSLGPGVSDFSDETVVQLDQPPRRIDLLTSVDAYRDALWREVVSGVGARCAGHNSVGLA